MTPETLEQAAERLGITQRRLRALCQQGRIKGAKKLGKMWVIPRGAKPSRMKHGQRGTWR